MWQAVDAYTANRTRKKEYCCTKCSHSTVSLKRKKSEMPARTEGCCQSNQVCQSWMFFLLQPQGVYQNNNLFKAFIYELAVAGRLPAIIRNRVFWLAVQNQQWVKGMSALSFLPATQETARSFSSDTTTMTGDSLSKHNVVCQCSATEVHQC